jgi:hypothetical protein
LTLNRNSMLRGNSSTGGRHRNQAHRRLLPLELVDRGRFGHRSVTCASRD